MSKKYTGYGLVERKGETSDQSTTRAFSPVLLNHATGLGIRQMLRIHASEPVTTWARS